MARKVENDLEYVRQEGREEALNWLVKQEIINYSTPENKYFYYDRATERLVVLPWQREM